MTRQGTAWKDDDNPLSTAVTEELDDRAGTVWKDDDNPLSTAVTEELDDNLTDASLSTAARHGGADGKGHGRTAIGWA